MSIYNVFNHSTVDGQWIFFSMFYCYKCRYEFSCSCLHFSRVTEDVHLQLLDNTILFPKLIISIHTPTSNYKNCNDIARLLHFCSSGGCEMVFPCGWVSFQVFSCMNCLFGVESIIFIFIEL